MLAESRICKEMGDVEVENHAASENSDVHDIRHEMNPDMTQMGGHHDGPRGPPDQVNFPGPEQGNFGGQPQQGQPQEEGRSSTFSI